MIHPAVALWNLYVQVIGVLIMGLPPPMREFFLPEDNQEFAKKTRLPANGFG